MGNVPHPFREVHPWRFGQIRMSMYSSPEPEKNHGIFTKTITEPGKNLRIFEPSTVSYERSTSTNMTHPIHFFHLDNQLFLVCYLGDIVWALPLPVDNYVEPG